MIHFKRLGFSGPAAWLRRAVLLVLIAAGVSPALRADGSLLAQPVEPRIQRLTAAAERPSGNLHRAYGPVLSADGQLVVFWSSAADLVTNDTNGAVDVFVADRHTGVIERVSTASDGSQANGPSLNAALSPDGRYVAFESRATNLAARDTNATSDIFLKDRASGALERISLSTAGGQGNGPSYRPAISADGRFVAFWSEAGNLVPDDDNGSYDNGGYDIFVKDRLTGVLERASVAQDGTEAVADSVAPSLSADGRFVAFGSYASNLVDRDNNGMPDIFVKDRHTGAVERVSVAADGTESNGDSFWNAAISPDGRFVAFWSEASNLVPGDTNGLVDAFVKDRQTGAIERVSVSADGAQANGPSYNPLLSADGRFVVFWSEAINLVPGDSNGAADVFIKDRQTGSIERLSVADNGGQGNGPSYNPTISADSRFIAFWSAANNLTPDDANERVDVFVVDRTAALAR